MTRTVFGLVADQLGHASKQVLEQGALRPELRFRAWASPSTEYRTIQNNEIRVDRNHDHQWVGQVIHLERRGGNLWAVAEVDDTVTESVAVKVGNEVRNVPNELYWSAERRGGPDLGGLQLLTVSLTAVPARIAARPVVFRDGNASLAARQSHDHHERDLLHRASETDLKRHGGPLIIVDDNPPGVPVFASRGNSQATVEVRSAELADVSVERREITALVAPYEHPAQVTVKGRQCSEMFAAGAFDKVAEQGNTIRLNFDHRIEKVVGRAVEFDTSHADGLIATFKVARTRLGDEALELAREDCVDTSVGFGVVRESWPQRNLRLVHEGWLDHVGLTSSPAYTSAKVLGVRDGTLALH